MSAAQFTVAPEIFARLPGLTIVVAWATGLDNDGDNPTVDDDWASSWATAGLLVGTWPNPQSHPHVKAWGDRLKAAGVSRKDFPPSVEAVLRRAMKRGPRFSINPLVDFYNAVALRHVVPAGAFDVGALPQNVVLRTSRAGDTFWALDADAPVPVPEGEMAYAAGSTVLTRHLMWRQSQAGLVTPATTTVLFMSELLPEHPADLPDRVADGFQQGFQRHFGVDPQMGRITADDPTFTWTR